MYTRDAYLTPLKMINLAYSYSFALFFSLFLVIGDLILFLCPCVSLSLGLSVFLFFSLRLFSVVLTRTRTSRTDLGEIPRHTRGREFSVEMISAELANVRRFQ